MVSLERKTLITATEAQPAHRLPNTNPHGNDFGQCGLVHLKANFRWLIQHDECGKHSDYTLLSIT